MEIFFFPLGRLGGGGYISVLLMQLQSLLLGFVTAFFFFFLIFFFDWLVSLCCFLFHFLIGPLFLDGFARWRAFTSAHSKVTPLSAFSLHLYRWPFIIIIIIIIFFCCNDSRKTRRRGDGGDWSAALSHGLWLPAFAFSSQRTRSSALFVWARWKHEALTCFAAAGLLIFQCWNLTRAFLRWSLATKNHRRRRRKRGCSLPDERGVFNQHFPSLETFFCAWCKCEGKLANTLQRAVVFFLSLFFSFRKSTSVVYHDCYLEIFPPTCVNSAATPRRRRRRRRLQSPHLLFIFVTTLQNGRRTWI